MNKELATKKYYWGIDCGSAEIKIVLLDSNKKIIARHKQRTLFPLIEHVRSALCNNVFPFDPFKPNHKLVATGYGRNRIDFAHDRLTEIKAHFLGVQAQLDMQEDYTLIDIGGQDSKVVVVKNNSVDQFVINRKCAAGTGAFIEELAHRLEVNIEKLSELDKKHDKKLVLNSFCTVFAAQEVIKILMHGEKVENLIHALYVSVVKRVLEMTPIPTCEVVFSGGVLHYHPPLHEIFKDKLPGKNFALVPQAQYCGALGAAIWGMSN